MTDEIFVAIAAYREQELRQTVESCIDNADSPDRLRFGICLQFEDDGPPETGPDCLRGLDANIAMIRRHWTQSKGGCWARHLTQSLYDGEAYTLQIDSHSRMAPGWDSDLIQMMSDFPSSKPLITAQLGLYDLDGDTTIIHDPDREVVRVTVTEQWSDAGWIHHPSRVIPTERSHPRPTRILSGMFVFTHGAWNVEVRQDPEHLYAGEEFALTVRSFTSGYDLFNPSHVVAWTRHHPEPNKKFISHHDADEVKQRHEKAMKRLRLLLRGDPDRILVPYSVGDERTVSDYSDWSGLDCASFTLSDEASAGVAPPLPPSPEGKLSPPALPA